MEAKLIYFGDPMCSWCWGIAQHLNHVREQYEGKLDFELVMGGLRPGGGDAWTDEFKGFLREHWEHVQTASGQPFDFGLLERDSFNYDTEPASRAVRIIRDLAPKQEFAFFKSVQRRFYAENEDPNEVAFYEPLCEEIGVSFPVFTAAFNDPQYQEKVRADFMKSQQYGIRGFPSVVLQRGDDAWLVANGYVTAEQLTERVEAALVS